MDCGSDGDETPAEETDADRNDGRHQAAHADEGLEGDPDKDEDEEEEDEDEGEEEDEVEVYRGTEPDDTVGWRRRYYSWERYTDSDDREERTGSISDSPWACEVYHVKESAITPIDSSAHLGNRFERDVFYLARSFVLEEWKWRGWDRDTRSWRNFDTNVLKADYERLFEPDWVGDPEQIRTPYRFAYVEPQDRGWVCPPDLIDLFSEIFADKGRRPDAAEAAARIRTIVER